MHELVEIRSLLGNHLDMDSRELQPLEAATDEEILLGRLAEFIRYLLDNDRQRLFAAAYRIDISEPMLRQALYSGTSDTVALNIAALIIQREKQKIETRRRYRQDSSLLPD
ncbi:hypothetical protein [Rhodoflexus sp.]